MNEHKTVTEPAGYDYAPTERIPAQGDLPRDRSDHDGQPDDHAVTEHADLATERTDQSGFPAPAHDADPVVDTERAQDADPVMDVEPVVDADRTHDADPVVDAEGAHDGEPGYDAEHLRDAEPVPEPMAETATTTEFAEPAAATSEPAAGERPADEELFAEDAVRRFRERWREVQAGFVDDPSEAVRGANELVDEIMHELAEHKQRLEAGLGNQTDTEQLRVAIREYRAFFNQLLNV